MHLFGENILLLEWQSRSIMLYVRTHTAHDTGKTAPVCVMLRIVKHVRSIACNAKYHRSIASVCAFSHTHTFKTRIDQQTETVYKGVTDCMHNWHPNERAVLLWLRAVMTVRVCVFFLLKNTAIKRKTWNPDLWYNVNISVSFQRELVHAHTDATNRSYARSIFVRMCARKHPHKMRLQRVSGVVDVRSQRHWLDSISCFLWQRTSAQHRCRCDSCACRTGDTSYARVGRRLPCTSARAHDHNDEVRR